MKRISVALLFLTVLVSLNACRKVTGHGPVVMENRNVSNFTSIHFDLPGDLYYTEDNQYKLEIHAQENIIKEIETYVAGNELKVKVPDHIHLRSREDIRIMVSGPAVTELSLRSSGNIKITQPYKPANARLFVRGSGSITINHMETTNVDASVSGSGDLRVFNGKAKYQDVEISGSGRIDLLGIIADTARAEISGSGSIRLHVNDELNSKILGSGTVYYKGNPAINTTVSGSGKVVRL